MAREAGNFARWLLASLLLVVAVTSATASGKRIAIVVGNSAYQAVPFLPNPITDATDVEAALRRLDFSVTRIDNASFEALRRSLIAFGDEAAGAEMAAIFFAGHGMEVGGENWLIPVDATLRNDRNIEGEAVSLRFVLQQVSGASRLSLVMLDACRNNPFAARMNRSSIHRTVDRGLARVEPKLGNTLVAYAARDGATAEDGIGHNSPFTTALLKNIETPGLEINLLFRKIRDDVLAVTNRDQEPFVYSSLSADPVYLRGTANDMAKANTFDTKPAQSGRSVVRMYDLNGSKMRLDSNGAERRFVYAEPREGLKTSGVASGMTEFEGRQVGDTYEGTAYVFSKICGPVSYPVKGQVSPDGTIVMRGTRYYVDPKANCVRSPAGETVLMYQVQPDP